MARCFALSPDGHLLAIGTRRPVLFVGDPIRRMDFYDLVSGTLVRRIEGGGAIAQYVASQTVQLDGIAIPTVTFESPPLGSYAHGIEIPSVLNLRIDSDPIAQYTGRL